MTNKELVEKYKYVSKFQATYFKDSFGNLVDGIVAPLDVDNRSLFSRIDDQGSNPWCVAYGTCNFAESMIWKKTGKLVNINPEQVYAGCKAIDGSMNTDGSSLEAGLTTALKLGCFDMSQHKIVTLVNDGTNAFCEKIKHMIHKHDLGLGGWNITTEWYNCSNDNYIISKHGHVSLGGHCMTLCGYDQTGVYIANSWGQHWGANGFCIQTWECFKKEFIYAAFLT